MSRPTRAQAGRKDTLLHALAKADGCERCGKPLPVCICDRLEPLVCRTKVLILQHPQEDDVVLGTARLVASALPSAMIRPGLSWASLDQALGRAASRRRWAVLATAKLQPGVAAPTSGVGLTDRHGSPLALGSAQLEGLVVLDGTWSQAKTLWWRNPWLLKLPRVHLIPREPSMYGALRREPRAQWVSTLEAIADVLPALGEPEATRTALRRLLRTMLQRVRDVTASTPPPAEATFTT